MCIERRIFLMRRDEEEGGGGFLRIEEVFEAFGRFIFKQEDGWLKD